MGLSFQEKVFRREAFFDPWCLKHQEREGETEREQARKSQARKTGRVEAVVARVDVTTLASEHADKGSSARSGRPLMVLSSWSMSNQCYA